MFKRLFSSAPSSPDGLTQVQREAIVDLLHYCLYADTHIALAEDAILQRVRDSLAWEPAVSFESYEVRSVASARAARESDAARDEFLADATARLGKAEVRARALGLCERLLGADGTTPAESETLARLRAVLS